MQLNEKINLITYKNLEKFPEISHFTTTRQGGVSSGNYASLNVSEYAGDENACVAKNRMLLSDCLQISPSQIIIPFQTHGDEIKIIPTDFFNFSTQERTFFLHGVDALITNFSDFCIGITTADCVPVLLYDPINKVVAAIHAGWRGTVLSIVEKTIRKMQYHFSSKPEEIYAAIGPCIGKDMYEVGPEVVDAFEENGFPMKVISFFNEKTAKFHIDLAKANEYVLKKSGVYLNNIEVASVCTFENSDTFFSARKLGIHSGRMVSVIMLNNENL